jgi:ferredoxin-nitrite reductase
MGLSSVQSGMDNVRNMTGSPIAGIDPHEFIDVRPLNIGAPQQLNANLGAVSMHFCPRKYINVHPLI